MVTSGTDGGLEEWIERQYRLSVAGLLRSISCSTVKERPGFGQRIVPRRGSVVACPVPASWDPDPDYFFHWYRDSAAVMDALRVAYLGGEASDVAIGHFADYVAFSAGLLDLDGLRLAEDPSWRARARSEFIQFVRPADELRAISGDAALAETRVNPDGTIDISRWPRPQNDGPAATALTMARWLASGAALPAQVRMQASRLIHAMLDFTLRHWHAVSFDIWEEEEAHHYYTLRIQAAALEAGATLEAQDDGRQAYEDAAAQILHRLDAFWLLDEEFIRSRVSASGERSAKDLDIAVILAANHAGEGTAPHLPGDSRLLATLRRLESYFSRTLAINRDRRQGLAPALGRYPGDSYFGGGAWYVATLAGAEHEFRRVPSLRAQGMHDEAADAIARGDAYFITVRSFVPASGMMSEQIDRETGAPLSAKDLAWSYAAFITATAARRAAKALRG
jgi:glucoamylase